MKCCMLISILTQEWVTCYMLISTSIGYGCYVGIGLGYCDMLHIAFGIGSGPCDLLNVDSFLVQYIVIY